jgi:hypothetical protein
VKRSEAEINRILDEDLPGVFERFNEAGRTALVKALQVGHDPYDAEDIAADFAAEIEHKEAVKTKDRAVMQAICEKHRPKNPDPQMR